MIEGVFRVIDAATGEPLPGVVVQPYTVRRAADGAMVFYRVEAGPVHTTDADGHVVCDAPAPILFRKVGYREHHLAGTSGDRVVALEPAGLRLSSLAGQRECLTTAAAK